MNNISSLSKKILHLGLTTKSFFLLISKIVETLAFSYLRVTVKLFDFRQRAVFVQYTILSSWIPEAVDSLGLASELGEVGRCYGVGPQRQNLLLQWHNVLEVSWKFLHPYFLVNLKAIKD